MRKLVAENALCALLMMIAPSVARTASHDQPTPQSEKPAEQAYKNIQLFTGLPSSKLMSAMFFMEGSLQVNCGHCHVWEDFSKDDKPAKRTARKMILMVRQLNELQFQGKETITCNTCHRGHTTPVAPLSFASVDEFSTRKSISETASAGLPTAEQLFARHLQAAGGEAALTQLHSRVMKGTRWSSEGWSSPVQIEQEAPDKWKENFTVQAQFVNVFDGMHGWNQDNNGVHDLNSENLAKLKEDAVFYRDLKLREMFPEARAIGKEKIDGKDCYLVEAKSTRAEQRQLYFDAQTGLLARIVRFDLSPFGPIPDAVDYGDYRELDGVQVPFTIKHLRPDYSLMDRFTEIKQNITIEPNTFHKPMPPSIGTAPMPKP